MLIGNGNLPIRAGNLQLSAWSRIHAMKRLGFYLDNGGARSPGSGKMNFLEDGGEPAAAGGEPPPAVSLPTLRRATGTGRSAARRPGRREQGEYPVRPAEKGP